MLPKYSLDKRKIKVLLLEGIHKSAVDFFTANGYTEIETLSGSLDDAGLKAKIRNVNIIGIRSRTEVTEEVLSVADKLFAIGCFSIGTNQVDGRAARLRGIPVFNAPFSNTRSVAELVIAECILLMRNIPVKNAAAHKGKWLKSVSNSFEIRGKNLGIIGYGHLSLIHI